MSKATVDALFARGFDSRLAHSLVKQGYTLNKLKTLSVSKLKSLGLSDNLADEVRKGGRPPIPSDRVYKLLFEARWMCCRCRERQKPIILHHIDQWHVSHSHEEDNLVVLCLNCHDEAHSRRDLSLNLTPAALRDNKARWVEQVRVETLGDRLKAHLGPMSMPVWDYFNHVRILDLADKCGVPLRKAEGYRQLLAEGLISKSGERVLDVRPKEQREYEFVYQLLDRRIIPFYESVLKAAVVAYPLVDLSESWNQPTVRLLQPGSVVMYA